MVFKHTAKMCLKILSVFVLVSCANDDLPESFRLESFRVLAIIADQPEVAAATTVILTPLLSDITGKGRPISFSAQACVDPGVGFGAEPTCDDNPTRVSIAANQTAVGLASPNYTGLLTSTISVTVPPSTVIFNNRSSDEQFNGVNYLVTIQFTPQGETPIRTFKRILVSTRPVKHQNPTYDSTQLFSGNTTLSALPKKPTDIRVKVSSASAESYEEKNDEGSIITSTEEIDTFWYISDGDLSLVLTENSNDTEYSPPETLPTGRDVMIVAVTRDSRGGQATLIFSF